MCFTPTISISTAIFEFIVAIFILFYFKKSPTKFIIASLIFLLGLYQLSEFLLCTSANPFLWAKIGFIIYSLLPATILHFAIKSHNKKSKAIWVYILPLIFIILSILTKNFIVETNCLRYYAYVHHLFYFKKFIFFPYIAYYIAYILASAIILWFAFKKESDKKYRITKFISFLFMIILMIAAGLFFVVSPAIYFVFPSIYCLFAISFTIMILIDAFYSKKI